jgi:hypothetical protein
MPSRELMAKKLDTLVLANFLKLEPGGKPLL